VQVLPAAVASGVFNLKFEIGNLKSATDTEADQGPGNDAPLVAVKSPAPVALSGSTSSLQPPASSLLREQLIPLNDAANLLRRRVGGRLSKPTLWRWATQGIHSAYLPPGQRARLETRKLGQTRYTSIEALERFAAQLGGGVITEPPASGFGLRAAGTAGTDEPAPVAGARSGYRTRRQRERAKARLIAAGFMERPAETPAGN
jgi:hypothetical protein